MGGGVPPESAKKKWQTKIPLLRSTTMIMIAVKQYSTNERTRGKFEIPKEPQSNE